MHVIRRGLLALILTAPMVVAASAASAPASQADTGASCLSPSSGANVAGNTVGTFVCLTVDSNPVPPQPLSTGSDSDSPPLICWLEPQYQPAQLQNAISLEPDPALKSAWQTQFGAVNPPYEGGANGWWWGVGCDPTNLLAATYRQELWAEVGLSGLDPWEWEADDAAPDSNQAITDAMLAEYAWEAATLDAPAGQMSPTYTGGVSTQTVGLPTYFWGQIGAAGEPAVAQHTIIATVGPLESELIAVPQSVTITTTGATTGNSTIPCQVTNGTFGTADPDDKTISGDSCSFTYTQPSNDVTVTMTTNWKVTWVDDPDGVGWSKPAQSLPETFGGINVQEIQTLNNGGSSSTATPNS
jgi:hypothetical protein